MSTSRLLKIARQLTTDEQWDATVPLSSAVAVDDFIATMRQLIFQPATDELNTAALLNDAVKQLTLLAHDITPDSRALAERFATGVGTLRMLLRSDAEAIVERDPAAASLGEVVSCYPGITAILHYRVAHALTELGLPLLPRIISERAHALTGIDIHPSATIGASFAIDHGTGIVVGATARIGHHVMLYQGVTLGAKRFEHDADGRLIGGPRHPIVEDYVTIYSNTSVLGRVRVGHHSVVGGNLWITSDVPPCSQVRQSKPIQHVGFIDGEGI